MRVTFNGIEVEHSPVSYWQYAYTFHYLLRLNDRGHRFFPHLECSSVNDIYAFIELFIFLEVIDTGVYHDPPYPTLKRTFVLKGVYLGKYFNKTLLQHILRIFPVVGKPVTHRKHLRTKAVV